MNPRHCPKCHTDMSTLFIDEHLKQCPLPETRCEDVRCGKWEREQYIYPAA